MTNDIYSGEQQKKTSLTAMVILGFMFFIFGFTSWINSILVPYFKIGCELNHFQSYLIVFAMYLAYLIMALPAGNMLKAIGYKKGIMLGFFTVAAGALVFLPAAVYRSYPLFLLGSFVMGLGAATLQSAANPYVTVIGPLSSSVKRMAIMGICNKFAGLIAPLIFAAVIFSSNDEAMFSTLENAVLDPDVKNAMLDGLVRRVMMPYGIFAAFLVLVGAVIRFSNLPEINLSEENKGAQAAQAVGKTSVFQFPYLILGVIAMFFHISTQVVTVDTIISYAGTLGINIIDAKVFPSYTFALVILGNVLGIILIPKIVSQTKVFQTCCLLGLLLSVGVVWGNFDVRFLGFDTSISIWFLVGLGLANSLIYAGIWPLAIRNLGPFTKTGSSMLIMALFGNAITPLFYGWLVDVSTPKMAYLFILIPCFAYLVWYSFRGYKIESWKCKSK